MAILNVTDKTVDKAMAQREEFILFFHANFAGPSHIMKQTLDDYGQEEGLDILCADVQFCEDLTNEYAIKAVPTIIYFRDGTIHRAIKGAITFDQIKELCE